MPDQSLDSLLQYRDTPLEDDFVEGVMERVRHKQLTRKWILIVAGLIGALFGVTGTTLLSDSISQLLTVSASSNDVLTVSLILAGVLAFLAWLLNDELGFI